MSISPIATLLSGPFAEIFGVGNLFLYCAILGIIVTILIWNLTSIKTIDYDSKSELEMITDNINSIKY
jgi:hypothetical protein